MFVSFSCIPMPIFLKVSKTKKTFLNDLMIRKLMAKIASKFFVMVVIFGFVRTKENKWQLNEILPAFRL
jgi:hypothetical protein